MSNDQRARLDLANLEDEPKPPVPVDPDRLRQTAEKAGFPATVRAPTTSTAGGGGARTRSAKSRPAEAEAAIPRRGNRLRTGRVHQFATRLDAATLTAIYAYGDHKQITLAEVIELAMAALHEAERQQGSNR